MTNYRICIQETGQDSFVKPTEAQGYLLAAKGMLEGATPLGSITPTPSLALTLLCGHACEAALKAILAKSGISAQKLSKAPYGHHILNLWEAAKTITTLQAPQPDWVSQLSRVYEHPFHLRYPIGLHGVALPNQRSMLDGTTALCLSAESFVAA